MQGAVAFHARNSFGAVTIVPIIEPCVYVMNVSAGTTYSAQDNEDTIYTALWEAVHYLGGATGCPAYNPAAYRHFVAYIPSLAFLPWAGIAEIPGRRTIINGNQASGRDFRGLQRVRRYVIGNGGVTYERRLLSETANEPFTLSIPRARAFSCA